MFTGNGYVPDEDETYDYDRAALDVTGATKPWAAQGEVSFYTQGLREWPAKLLNGVLFIFKPGYRYDLVFIRDDGWIEQHHGLIYMGNDRASNVGKFLAPAIEGVERKPLTARVIIAAQLAS